jgi:hypothetical protein
MNLKTKGISALFAGLIIILVVNPRILHDIYSNVLGRLFLLGIAIFLASNNVTLGLLVALILIIVMNRFSPLVEGMETPATIGEDNIQSNGEQKVLTKDAVSKKISELKASGVDKEDIKNAILAKDSNTLPIDPESKNSEEVGAFKNSLLTNKSSLTEGFCPCASPF